MKQKQQQTPGACSGINTKTTKNQSFTENDVVQAWESFKRTYSTTEETTSLEALYSLINLRVETPNIILQFSNRAFESLLNKIKPDILLFLREKLQNDSIQLQTVLVEIKDFASKTPILLTDSQRFELLASRYPLLYEFKEKLGLDFDIDH
ncbi:MAG: hypothetical protein NZM38_11265 [Cytophagales bacterium]|nr:hypothetical protein [Cytophagales bacterium]MDW8385335.1 hypothetical protein [Flammeovirgaceae bacterium]